MAANAEASAADAVVSDGGHIFIDANIILLDFSMKSKG